MDLTEKPIVGEPLEEIKKQNLKFVFPKTCFMFLNEHFGLRPECIHILLGETGKGKSTLCRSVALNYAAENEKIIYYSAEETLKSFSMGLDAKEGAEENVFFIGEKELKKKYDNFGVELVLEAIQTQLACHKSKILFFDNPTAGFIASDFKLQEKLYNGLREIADAGVTIFMPAHTKSSKERNFLTDPSDVRGSKHIANISDYFYSFYNFSYTFEGEEKIFSGVQTLKCRFHNSAGSIYSIAYDKDSRKYTKDYKIKFNSFLELWKKRQKLL